MKYLIYINLVIITLISCTEVPSSTELKKNFNKEEREDLQRLIAFFQDQMCDEQNDFKPCIDSVIPYLIEDGWQPILDNINFEEQEALYEDLQSNVFDEIWDFCKSIDSKDDKQHESLCINIEGRYIKFLENLSTRNDNLNQYYESIISSGDIESLGVLQTSIYAYPEKYDLNDPGIQILIVVHYLTQNDQQNRSKN